MYARHQRLPPLFKRGNRGQQRPRVRMPGRREKFVDEPGFKNLSILHQGDLIGDLTHHRKIVRDQQNRQPHFLLDFRQ